MSPEAECRPDDVVVIRLGTISPLRADVEPTWSVLHEKTCAVRILEHERITHHDLPVWIGAPLAPDLAEMLPPRQLRRLDRTGQCALLAARQAWEQAGAPQVASQHLAVSVSPGVGPVLSVMEAWDTLRDKGPRRVLPTAVPALMPNVPAAAVGIELGAHGGIHTPASACASGAEATAYGVDLITLGRADVVAAGGTDVVLHPMTAAVFAAMRALSTRNADPQTTSRPFAPDRDGFVLGEGAGLLVLECAAHAKARGARIPAVLAGSGVTVDTYDVARPESLGAGQERALRLALGHVGFDPGCVGHVNAHATSMPAGDVVEAGVLARTVPNAAISTTKSAIGHLLGGAGGLEAVLTVMAPQAHWVPPTPLPAGVDPEPAQLGLDIVGPQGRDPPQLTTATSTSFDFGGHSVALVFTRQQPCPDKNHHEVSPVAHGAGPGQCGQAQQPCVPCTSWHEPGCGPKPLGKANLETDQEAILMIGAYARGVLFVHSAPRALCPHIEWAAAEVLGSRVHLDWTEQPAVQGMVRTETSWVGPVGTGASLASVLHGWANLRYEVTEGASVGTDGGRWSCTPDLGIFHARTDVCGNVVMPEGRIRAALAYATDPDRVRRELDLALGQAWDDELEPFRYAGAGAPVHWLHRVG